MFSGHKRAPSVQGQETASSADSTNSSLNGAPLAPTLTHTSFTGVGTPLVANGTLSHERPPVDSTLLTTLHDLFVAISSQPKSTGTVAPQAFINQLKRDNEFFRSTLHQDAHEFLNYLVNMIAEALEKEAKERTAAGQPSEFQSLCVGSNVTLSINRQLRADAPSLARRSRRCFPRRSQDLGPPSVRGRAHQRNSVLDLRDGAFELLLFSSPPSLTLKFLGR